MQGKSILQLLFLVVIIPTQLSIAFHSYASGKSIAGSTFVRSLSTNDNGAGKSFVHPADSVLLLQTLEKEKSLKEFSIQCHSFLQKNYSFSPTDIRFFEAFIHEKLQNIKMELLANALKSPDAVNLAVFEAKELYKSEFANWVSNKTSFIKAFNTPHKIAGAIGCLNSDFEDGTTTGWQGYYGKYMSLPSSPNGFATGRHTIESGTNTDLYGSFPVVKPGGKYSLKLGNEMSGAESEMISYSFLVDPSNTSFTYSFAVVLEDGGHTSVEQPFFEINFVRQNGQVIPCTAYRVFVPTGSTPSNFLTSSVSTLVKYRPWTTIAVDLSPYVGETVTISFTTADCDVGGHFGYAYIDGSCLPFSILTGGPNSICNNDTLTLTAPPGAANYLWSGPNVTGKTTAQVKVNLPGTYNVQMTSVSGTQCNFSASINLGSEKISASITKSPAAMICPSDSTMLDVQITGAHTASYAWEPAPGLNSYSQSQVIAKTDSTRQYTVIVTSPAMCTSSAFVTVNVYPLPLSSVTASPSIVCDGDTVNLSLIGDDPSVKYTVNPPLIMIGNSGSSISIIPSLTTTYNFTATANTGCVSTKEFVMNVLSVPKLEVAEYYKLKFGSAIQLGTTQKQDSVIYSWDPPDYLNSSTIPAPSASPSAIMDYIINATDTTNGCVVRKRVHIDILCGEGDIYMPNAFTPNFDRVNDEITLEGNNIKDATLQIFDRWGVVVFNGSGKHPAWDGNFNEKPSQAGIYFYTLVGQCNNGELFSKQGNITLVR